MKKIKTKKEYKISKTATNSITGEKVQLPSDFEASPEALKGNERGPAEADQDW